MRWLFLLLPMLLAACPSGDPASGAATPPSILLVTVDTLRYDALGCSGATAARTPNIDRLASEGVRCRRVWTACPLTLPSHATLLTGLLPAEHGLRDNDPASPLAPKENRDWPTLAEALRDRGYTTGAFISASVLAPRTGMDQGFSVYDGPDEGTPGALRYAERRGQETARRACEWLRDRDGPFFLWVHLFDPHDPYDAPEPFRVNAPPNSPEAYAAEVSYADHCIGILSDALRKRGDPTDTLFIVTSDHGEGLGEHGEPTHGYLLHETTLHVPLIARWPGRVPSGVEWTDTMSLAEVTPWLLSAVDGDHETFLRGPQVRTLAAETLYGYRHMGWAQLFAAREADRKLIRGDRRDFYDLEADPEELSPSPAGSEVLRSAVNRYRALAARSSPAEPAPELPEGFPYSGGLGRTRLTTIPWKDNETRLSPDPRLAARIDAVKARVDGTAVREVELELAALVEEDPANPTLHFWIGRNAMKARLHKQAVGAFSRAFELGLREPKVLNLWLKEALLDGNLDEAGRIVVEMVPKIVPDTGTWAMACAYYDQSGDSENARRCADLAERSARTDSDRRLAEKAMSRFGHK